MARFYNFVFLFLIIVFQASAQVDTEFWFAPPEITSGHGDRPIILRISTQSEAATVRVVQPAREDYELANFTIAANTTRNIDLTAQVSVLETNLVNVVMKTGLRIISSAPITAYYEEGSFFNAEIFVLKGRNALGSKFIIPAQNYFNNSNDYSPTPYFSFDVVATKNNTVVKVRPTRPLVGHETDSVITIRLNAGETYSFRKVGLLAINNPSGTLIESSKPIAITIKDDSVIDGVCRDLLGDQLVPTEVAGMEYIVLKGFLNAPEFLFITATEDDTKVFLLGGSNPSATLKQGESYRYEVSQKATYIQSNKRIYVIHVTGFGCEVGMAILPQINCTGSKQIGFTRSTAEFFGMNVLVRKEGISGFKLNGLPLINGSQFTAVPGTNDKWYAAQLNFSSSQVPVGMSSLISNDGYSFQAGIINGDAQTSSRYGYFSSFSTLFIGDDFSFCEGSLATIDAGPGKESYLWNTGATTQSIDVNETGDYWVKVVREECVLYDTIHVDEKIPKEDLGPDLQICPGTSAKVDGKENFSWLWSNGSTDQFLETEVFGKYWVTVFDNTGCQASDTIFISEYVYNFNNDVGVNLNLVTIDTANERSIQLSWTVTDTERVESNKVFLRKRISGASEWNLLSTLSAAVDLYSDPENLTDDEVYEYYVGLSNRCGQEQTFSKVHNTIRLSGEADEASNSVTLNWNAYYDWKAGVAKYEIWRKLEGISGYQFVSEVNGTTHSFSALIANEGFLHNYVVRALEASGNSESWSNEIAFEFEHPVYVPNVFTPNQDSYNQYFEISNIQLYKDSKLRVIDRWGMIVFETSAYKNDWDGEGFSSGVYYYVLDLNRNNIKPIKGTVSILR